jgi:hypothetical protein
MTPEQERLLEKAERSLQAAQELNQKGFAEFAASRGYYSMFLKKLYQVVMRAIVTLLLYFRFCAIPAAGYVYAISAIWLSRWVEKFITMSLRSPLAFPKGT